MDILVKNYHINEFKFLYSTLQLSNIFNPKQKIANLSFENAKYMTVK